MTTLKIIALTCDFMGKILIAVTALMVHNNVSREKTIDKLVLKGLKREHYLGILGIVFILAGYILHLIDID